MSSQAELNLETLLSTLTPSGLRDTITTLAQQGQHPEEGVSLQVLTEHLCGDLDLGTGREGWAHGLRLKRTIVALVADLPDLRFIEGDS